MPTTAQVQWLKDKCPKPEECGKCLEVCPSEVFVMYAPEREPNKPPQRYLVSPVWTNFCTVCNKCMDICPNNAIKVSVKK
jgi:NAD-dependent dihydropyrimidine dehydrogenase PreA subunit